MKSLQLLFMLFLLVCVSAVAQEQGKLTVESRSDELQVFDDTLLIGRTPISAYPLRQGTHTLRFINAEAGLWNYLPKIETVMVVAGSELRREITLEKNSFIPRTVNSALQGDVSFDSSGGIPAFALEGKTVQSNTPLYLTTAGAVLSGAVAAFFKIQADNEYENYKRTGDRSILDTVKRNDTISGIALAACEINLAALTYLLLSR